MQRGAQPDTSSSDSLLQPTADSGAAQPISDSKDHVAETSPNNADPTVPLDAVKAPRAQPVLKKTSRPFAEAMISGNVDGPGDQSGETLKSESPQAHGRDIDACALVTGGVTSDFVDAASAPQAKTPATSSNSEDIEIAPAVSYNAPPTVQVPAPTPQPMSDSGVALPASSVDADALVLVHSDGRLPSTHLSVDALEAENADPLTPSAKGANANGTAAPEQPDEAVNGTLNTLANSVVGEEAADSVAFGAVKSRATPSNIQSAAEFVDTQAAVEGNAQTMADVGQRAAKIPDARSEAVTAEAPPEPSIHSGISFVPVPNLDSAAETSPHVKSSESVGVCSVEAMGKKDLEAVGAKRVGFASPIGTVVLLEQVSGDRTPPSGGSASVGVEEPFKSREPELLSRGSSLVGYGLSSLSPPLLSTRSANMSGTSFLVRLLLYFVNLCSSLVQPSLHPTRPNFWGRLPTRFLRSPRGP